MESQPQTPEFRINPKNHHSSNTDLEIKWSRCDSQFFLQGIIQWNYRKMTVNFPIIPSLNCLFIP